MPPVSPRHRRFCVAPMMRYSHRHARHFWRLLSPSALLYTEMLTAAAVIHGQRRKLLAFSPAQSPVALQLGGGDAAVLTEAARIGESWGYDEINLNCGCPSPRVQNGRFGACLMREPAAVHRIVAAMKKSVALPVTVKCRIGVDADDSDGDGGDQLTNFTQAVSDAGGDALIVHARRAWLQGLNPAQNRHIPPLDYARVRRLKKQFPHLCIIINGGIETPADAVRHAHGTDGAMLGRSICRQPYLLAQAERDIFGGRVISRGAVLRAMLDYIRSTPLTEWHRALTALAGLYHGCANNKYFRRHLSLPPADALQKLQTAPQWIA